MRCTRAPAHARHHSSWGLKRSVHLRKSALRFQTGVRNSIFNEGYDVARDGRFLVVNSIMESTVPVVLVTNWDAELKKYSRELGTGPDKIIPRIRQRGYLLDDGQTGGNPL